MYILHAFSYTNVSTRMSMCVYIGTSRTKWLVI